MLFACVRRSTSTATRADGHSSIRGPRLRDRRPARLRDSSSKAQPARSREQLWARQQHYQVNWAPWCRVQDREPDEDATPLSRRKKATRTRSDPTSFRTGPSSDDAHDVVFSRRHPADDPAQSTARREALDSYPAKVQGCLVDEVVVDRSGRDARLVGDRVDARSRGGVTGEDLQPRRVAPAVCQRAGSPRASRYDTVDRGTNRVTPLSSTAIDSSSSVPALTSPSLQARRTLSRRSSSRRPRRRARRAPSPRRCAAGSETAFRRRAISRPLCLGIATSRNTRSTSPPWITRRSAWRCCGDLGPVACVA